MSESISVNYTFQKHPDTSKEGISFPLTKFSRWSNYQR